MNAFCEFAQRRLQLVQFFCLSLSPFHTFPAQISVFDVVVGDVFRANNGELLPCDGVLISGQNVKAGA